MLIVHLFVSYATLICVTYSLLPGVGGRQANMIIPINRVADVSASLYDIFPPTHSVGDTILKTPYDFENTL